MVKQRTLEIFEELLLIHSPSKKEKAVADYCIDFLQHLGVNIYLDHSQNIYGGNCPVIFGELPGELPGEGITLNAHMDVIEPNKNLNIIKEEHIWRSDGTTTLGGDDKGGLAALLSSIEYLVKHHIASQTIYIIITPGEEVGMLGAKNINWPTVYKHINPAKNMLVIDNAGKADKVAYQAPTSYSFKVTIAGQKAHAGIEPEKGINAIKLAANIINDMVISRIDSFTTANISQIYANFPHNVVPDHCEFSGEVRAHDKQVAEKLLSVYEKIIQKYTSNYKFEKTLDYPPLKSLDDCQFVDTIIKAYKAVGVSAEKQIIGGGSDANYFANEGFNAAIIGVGMEKVHTTEEYLDTRELLKTTNMLIHYLSH